MTDETTAPAAEGEAVPAAQEAAPAATDGAPTREQIATALVRQWASENLSNGPVSQHTEVWNAIQAAIPALVATILKDL